jgi:hypothetical protein
MSIPRLVCGANARTKKERDYADLFKTLGVMFRTRSGDEVIAETCPFCMKEPSKFYVNVTTGQYDCKHCSESGNAYTYVRWYYDEALRTTTDADYHRLKVQRNLPLQTLKRHGLAWDRGEQCWLIPYKSLKGEALNLTRYHPSSGEKYSLPCLPLCLYGLSDLSAPDARAERTLLILEGPFDAIAADHQLRERKTRVRFDLLAVPSAGTFRPAWFEHLKGYAAVRLCYDNDRAGREGQERVARLAREHKFRGKMLALAWPPDRPDKYDVSDLIRDGGSLAELTREHCKLVNAPGANLVFVRGDQVKDVPLEWLWREHIPLGSFVSLSGCRGSQKSLIARYLAARATAGLTMPNCATALAPTPVLYFTSEDSDARVRDLVKAHGGDLGLLHVHDIVSAAEPVDLLECLEEIEALIGSLGARLVVLDALNSFTGGDISSDSKARRTLSGRLHALARKTGACVLGLRNWGRHVSPEAENRALGAISLSDVARCTMNTEVLEKTDGQAWPYRLVWDRLTDAPRPDPLDYDLKDLSTGSHDKYMRRLVWRPRPTADFQRVFKANREKGSSAGDGNEQKGSEKG